MSVLAAIPGTGRAAATASTCVPTPFTAAFDQDLRTRWPANHVSASISDTRSGCSYEYHPRLRLTTASVFKIEVMTGVLLRAQDDKRDITSWEHARLLPMISRSADPPTNELFSYLGGTNGFAALNRRLGLAQTQAAPSVWGLTHTSASDQVKLVRQMLVGGVGPLTAESRERAWRYMGNVDPSQQWGVSEGAPQAYRIGMKNGFAPSQCCGWRINTAGFVSGPVGNGWVLVVLTDGWPSEAAGRRAMSMIARRLNDHFAATAGPHQ